MSVFATFTGEIRVDPARCEPCERKPCAAVCPEDILQLVDSAPVLAKPADTVRRGLCRECLACEVACLLDGKGGLTLALPIERLDS
jgi:NAD-dependent dihydropyrimidine dehydrogenase PreA subunit